MRVTVDLPDHLADRLVLAAHLLRQPVDLIVSQSIDWWLEDGRGPSLLFEVLRETVVAEMVRGELDGAPERVKAAMQELDEALDAMRARRLSWPPKKKEDALTFLRKARRDACEALEELDERIAARQRILDGAPADSEQQAASRRLRLQYESDRAYFAAQSELMAEAAKLVANGGQS